MFDICYFWAREFFIVPHLRWGRASGFVLSFKSKSVFCCPVQSRHTDVYSALDFPRDVEINYVPYVLLENESFDCNYIKYNINANHSICNRIFIHWRRILVYFINEDSVREKAALKEKMFPTSFCVVRYIYWIWQYMIHG